MTLKNIAAVLLTISLLGCAEKLPEGQAPGAPGQLSVWAYAGKTGIGTAYTPYDMPSGQQSKV